MQTTPISLLERLRDRQEQAAWERFVHLYTPLLSHWARRLGVHGGDVADLLQDVFAVLIQKLPEFRYDPQQRFRGWLWTITLNKWRERCRRQRLRGVSVDPELLDVEAMPDVAEVVSEAEYRQYLIQRALELMQSGFQPATWKAFWEFVVAERPASEVARSLGLTENAVYLAKGRVLRRLRQELEGLWE